MWRIEYFTHMSVHSIIFLRTICRKFGGEGKSHDSYPCSPLSNKHKHVYDLHVLYLRNIMWIEIPGRKQRCWQFGKLFQMFFFQQTNHVIDNEHSWVPSNFISSEWHWQWVSVPSTVSYRWKVTQFHIKLYNYHRYEVKEVCLWRKYLSVFSAENKGNLVQDRM